MSHGFAVSFNRRMALVGVAVALLIASFSAVGASSASASVGFCEFVKLSPGGSCQYGAFTKVTSVIGEVTSGSGEICVAIIEAGGVTVGKQCAKNYVQSQAGVGANSGKAWIKNNSGSTLTVTGLFTQ